MSSQKSLDQGYGFSDLKDAVEAFDKNYSNDISAGSYFGFPLEPLLTSERRLLAPEEKTIAYFSMEFGIAPSIYNTFQLSRPMSAQNQFFSHEVFSNYWLCDYLFKVKIDKMLDIPIYGGGLGVLAGDVMKSAADLGTSLVGLGVLWNKGYFKQNFWYKRGQVPEELTWDPWTYPGLIPLKNIVVIDTKEGPLHLRLWKYYVYSYDRKHACPIVLLDSNLPQNPDHFKKLTDQLYRSDDVWWKIFQRTILGIGGMKALKSLGYAVNCYHLNEGHAAFAILEKYVTLQDKGKIRDELKHFVFTCHTPVAAGHDRFSLGDVGRILNQDYIDAAHQFGKENEHSDQVNLTFMSLNNCQKVNAVAAKHGEVMRLQFPAYKDKIGSITNGVHLHTWLSSSFSDLFDRYPDTFGDWRASPENLVKVDQLKGNAQFRREIFEAHLVNKRTLMGLLEHWGLKEDVFTLGWARRVAGYKRPGLIFQDIEAIVKIARKVGPLQIIMAGKAHPNDNIGGAHIDRILDHIDRLNEHKGVVKVLMLENYDTFFGKLLTNCVDVWLNNPLPPFEASGTSGMKAIMNGVLQLTTLDGWVVEAAEDNIGWLFGFRHSGQDIGSESDLHMDEDSRELYDTLGQVVSLYYATHANGEIQASSAWIDKMINCIRRAAFFNTQRMVKEYREQMWQV